MGRLAETAKVRADHKVGFRQEWSNFRPGHVRSRVTVEQDKRWAGTSMPYAKCGSGNIDHFQRESVEHSEYLLLQEMAIAMPPGQFLALVLGLESHTAGVQLSLDDAQRLGTHPM